MRINKLALVSIVNIIIFNVNLAAVINVPLDYSKIQWAINAASSGDTILVSVGTYYENINYQGKSIVVKAGNSPDLVVIDGSQPAVSDTGSVVIFASGETSSSVLDGFTITGGTGTITNVGKRGGGILCSSSKPTIKNCVIKGNQSACGGGIGLWHINYQMVNGTLVVNCIIINNSATSGYGGGVWAGYSAITISNCTMDGNTASDGGGNFCASSFGAGSLITNSILWSGSIVGAISLANINYCDIEGGWSGGTGNIDANPLFCNSGTGDYHIAANSPCLGTGQGGTMIGTLGQGCEAIVDVEDQLVLPKQHTLLENYPNPFNPSTTIAISIPHAGFVTLKIFDIRGIELKCLFSGNLNTGEHSYIWDAKEYSSGTYFVKLQTDTYSETHTMLLLK
jgi:hypothetical protein